MVDRDDADDKPASAGSLQPPRPAQVQDLRKFKTCASSRPAQVIGVMPLQPRNPAESGLF
jgi:hypothetical protein